MVIAETKLVFGLIEQNSDIEPLSIETELLICDGKLWIKPNGFGDKTSQDGFGYPIGLEIWGGNLRLVVWPDINEENATIVDMENAKETNRE